MADIKIKYGTEVTLTIDLAPSGVGLASSTTKVIGRASTAVENGTTLALDYLLGGKVTTGTSPTANRTIQIWLYGEYEDTPTYPDSITGTDAGKTMTSENVRNSALKLAATIVTDNTSSRPYYFGPLSVAACFGGALPESWGIFVVHDTGVALYATSANHTFYARPVLAQTV